MTHTNEGIIGSPIFNFQEVTSTNDVARTFYNQGIAPHGSVIVAAYQANGRGQQDAVWESKPSENLLFSLVLEPHFLPIDKQVYLNMAVCLAVKQAIQLYVTEQVSIKWPNDIFIGNKKVAGILIENAINSTHIKMSIAGIGINVNQEVFKLPKATSLRLVTGKSVGINEVLNRVIDAFIEQYTLLKQNQWDVLMSAYYQSLYLKDIESTFVVNSATIKGIVKGMDQSGRLMLEVNGNLNYFHNKEIEWLI